MSSLAPVMDNSDDEKPKYKEVKKDDLIKLDFYQKGSSSNMNNALNQHRSGN